ncbi:hypothetical protein ACJRO7_004530 [Eucalyptus globulus]|uniref:Uncharacterized protein n=1 Tax=Eucalyptus globulus TaxID=34317 RepID=A0ABD3IZQ6_EUCGL
MLVLGIFDTFISPVGASQQPRNPSNGDSEDDEVPHGEGGVQGLPTAASPPPSAALYFCLWPPQQALHGLQLRVPPHEAQHEHDEADEVEAGGHEYQRHRLPSNQTVQLGRRHNHQHACEPHDVQARHLPQPWPEATDGSPQLWTSDSSSSWLIENSVSSVSIEREMQ